MGAVRLSTGGVVAVCERVSAAQAPVEADIEAAVRAAAVACVDETGFKEAKNRFEVWVSARHAALFRQLHPTILAAGT